MKESKARILVAEDDADINHLVCEILEKNGYDTVSAFSGTEASLRLERDNFDLLALDLMLPGMDGETLLETLTAQQREQMMVLVLSARSSLTDKVQLLKSGADDYMTKPFEPEELLARVCALLRRSGKGTISVTGNGAETDAEAGAGSGAGKGEDGGAYVLSYKNLCLFPEARSVRIGGEELELTRHEYEILALLVQSPDKVFSREALYEQIWNGGYYGEDNTVNVHVSNLRKKLAAKDPQTEYIRTVWGIGFKMA